MRTFLWVAGGTLLVPAAFFLGGGVDAIWQSLLFSYLTVILFLFTFLIFNRQTNQSKTSWAAGVAILIVISGIYGWLGYRESSRQDRNLQDIRQTIETGIAKNYVNKMLLQTLKDYTTSAERSRDFGTLFRARYDSLMTNGEIEFFSGSRDESLQIELTKASSDSIILVAYSSFVPGKKETFENYDGGTGHVQSKGILTASGIKYAREN